MKKVVVLVELLVDVVHDEDARSLATAVLQRGFANASQERVEYIDWAQPIVKDAR